MPYVEGLLLSGRPGGPHLVLGRSASGIDSGSIESVEILESAHLPEGCEAVRVRYHQDTPPDSRAGASTDGLESGRLLPLAMATRPEPARIFESPRYERIEAAFLEQSLLVDPADGNALPT